MKFQCDPVWHEHVLSSLAEMPPRPQCGDLLSSERIIANTDDKKEAAKNGAIAVDMESAAILCVANENQIPALVIRVAIDPYNYSIPDFILKNHDQYGEIDTVSLVRSILLRPARLITLMSLGRYYRAATKSLRRISNNLDLVLMQSNE
jgi:hypothetical protein